MRLYPLSASVPVVEFETDGHILVTLALIFHDVLEPSREESWSYITPAEMNRELFNLISIND